MNTTAWIVVALAAVASFAVGYLLAALRQRRAATKHVVKLHEAQQRSVFLEEQINQLQQDLGQQRQQMTDVQSRSEAAMAQASSQQRDDAAQIARLEQQLVDAKASHHEQLQMLEQAKAALTNQFKAIAAEALKSNADTVSKQQQDRLGDVLAPLKERLQHFERQVKDAYDKENRERISLQEQLKNLMAANSRLGEEAAQLARALTSQAKTRGDWGEQMLEQLLQHAGLRRDLEYRVQVTGTSEDGSRLQPDVVIDLPDEKHLVIDSKLSLVSWMELVEAEEESARTGARKALALAVREHVKQLSAKKYESLFQLASVDFVLMFIPIEGAFAEVITYDRALYQEAMDSNIVLVSPTTLLATMRTIAAIWRYDRQERHAFQIAAAAGKMYDQLVAYTDSLDKVGDRIRQAQEAFDQAQTRLVSGRGNVIRRAEIVKELGAKAAKKIGKELSELAQDDALLNDASVNGEPRRVGIDLSSTSSLDDEKD